MIIVMVGPAGSGKSTRAAEYSKWYNAVVVSSDAIREELFGSAAVQKSNDLVFKIVFDRIEQALKEGKNVVFDATNIYKKDRIAFLKHFKPLHNGFIVAAVMNTPIEETKKRNQSRERVVPEEVIDRQFKRFSVPTKEEGWDEIYFIK